VDLEAPVGERVDVVQLTAGYVKRALGIHDHLDPGGLDKDVAIGRMILEIHFILEPGTTTAHDRHPQDAGRTPLLLEQPTDLAGGGLGQLDQAFIAQPESRLRGRLGGSDGFLNSGGNHLDRNDRSFGRFVNDGDHSAAILTLPRAVVTVAPMSRLRWQTFLILFGLLGFVFNCPAPLIYRPGEGWVYERVGEDAASWQRGRAQDQLQVAQEAFDAGDISRAIKAARRVVRQWPLSDYAPDAQYLLGRCYEEKEFFEKAFKTYQDLIEKYPKSARYTEVLERQFQIAGRYLDGRWFRLWNYIPALPSMERTAKMYSQIVGSGPFSRIGPKAQMNIGAAREKQREYRLAVDAYIRAADRYHDLPGVAEDAVFKAAQAWHKQANEADYDQSTAGEAINTYTDFTLLFPQDPRVSEARQAVRELRNEQAAGAFTTARYYEKRRRWLAAEIYYNEVLLRDPESEFAEAARQRLAELKPHTTRLKQEQQASAPGAAQSN
jgi:outer membrane protein assembly factor BamD